MINTIVKRMVGVWEIWFPGLVFKLALKPGHFTLNGKKIVFFPSAHVRFPLKLGWFKFTFHSLTYYIKITTTGVKIFRFNKNGKTVLGTGNKAIGIIYVL